VGRALSARPIQPRGTIIIRFFGSRLTAHGLRLTAYGLRLPAHGSRLTEHIFMVRG
jgi:hypothetical protein